LTLLYKCARLITVNKIEMEAQVALNKYTVTVLVTFEAKQEIEVEAQSVEEACEIAESQCNVSEAHGEAWHLQTETWDIEYEDEGVEHV